MWITQQDQHTNIWDALQSDSPPIPGGLTDLSHHWTNPYHTPVLSAKQRLKNTRKDYSKRPIKTQQTSSGHNPGAQSHTSTSGPLIRRRVTTDV